MIILFKISVESVVAIILSLGLAVTYKDGQKCVFKVLMVISALCGIAMFTVWFI